MSAGDGARPESYSWIAKVYAKRDHGNDELVGCGVVIDDQRILTCAHVVGRFEEGRGWVADAEVRLAFPMSDEGDLAELLPVQGVVFPDSGKREDDVAVLYLAGTLPAGVKAAALRCPESGSLASGRWRVLGFPEDPVGEASAGTVEELARGWIRLNKESGDRLRLGFSGSGVWSAEYEAVVAVVTQAGGGDGRALTLRRAVECLPGENLEDLAWWSLSHDRDAKGHWEPRARGVSRASHRRPRFQGRQAALLKIKSWLDRDQASRRVLVVTGAPGAGKSAVLARIVTTADLGRHVVLPASDDGIRATAGSVGCAIHAKGKTALEVATEVARAASAELPDRLECFDDTLYRSLEERRISDEGSGPRPRRFNVIIDALDETVSPEQTRVIIREVVLPMARRCADAGAQVIVGLRRADAEGDLLEAFGRSAELVDLDSEEFFAREDLAAYAMATLQMADRDEIGSPYADDAVARPVADRIAELSDANFLVAGLMAQTHGIFDAEPVDPAALSFVPEVTSVMREYLRRIPEIAGMPRPTELLTALAFAEAPGFPTSLWRLALQTLGDDDVPEIKLAWFAQSPAASFLIESSEENGHSSVFRLFHQALNDALIAAVRPGTATQAEQALTHAFLKAGQSVGWEHAPAYLLRSLPAHAARAQLVDDLLADDAYLLHADLRRVLQATDRAESAAARDRARLVGLTPEAVAVDDPDERVAMFSVTEALDNLGNTYRSRHCQAPYRARWAVARPRTERASFNHQGALRAMCAITVEGQNLLATASDDCTVRLWDPRTSEQLSAFGERNFLCCRMCAITVDGRQLLATSDYDRMVTTNAYGGTVRLWDPRTGEQLTALDAYISGLCAITVDRRELLATIDKAGGPVRLWDPRTGEQLAALDGGSRGVRTGSRGVHAMCSFTVDGQTVLATCSHDSWVRLWDPRTGDQLAALNERPEAVGAMCAVTVDGQTLLATGGTAGTVRLWDPSTGRHLTTLGGPRSGRHGSFADSINVMCTVTVDGQDLLATGSEDGTVRLWDPQEGEQPAATDGHYDEINAMCAVTVDGRELLATGGGAVRLRDPHAGEQLSEFWEHLHGTHAVCAVKMEGRDLLASRDWDGWVALRDPSNGKSLSVFAIPGSAAMCAVTVDGHNLLVTGGDYGGMVRIWDPLISDRLADERLWNPNISKPLARVWRRLLRICRMRRRVPLWPQHISKPVTVLGEGRAVCVVTVDGQDLLVTGGRDGTVRIWDPRTGEELVAFGDRKGGVSAVCAVMVDGQTLLATGSDDGLVQVWDPRTGKSLVTIPTHHPVSAVAAVSDSLAIAFSFGILVIKLDVAARPSPPGAECRASGFVTQGKVEP